MLDIIDKNGISVLVNKSWEKYGIRAYFTTKVGEFSNGKYDSLNLGINTLDSQIDILKNYNYLCENLKLNFENLIMSNQIHGDKLELIKEKYVNSDPVFNSIFKDTDGFFTDIPGVVIVTHYADCVPVYIVDTKKKIVGICHSGWKGTVKKISRKMVLKYCEEYNSSIEDLEVWIGPHIGTKYFVVNEDVKFIFETEFQNGSDFITEGIESEIHIDLGLCIERDLLSMGIKPNKIIREDFCSYRDEELFFSYRRDDGNTGRMAAIITIDENIV